ncbi:MAG: hypothetical protein EBT03_10495 [Betaproteobacteria bacterium]|nr:hypothetical protein [Betaproteobacteria bacterium]
MDNIKTLDGSLFCWSGRTGTADASTLGFGPGVWPRMIAVRSPKTGHTVTFASPGVSMHDGSMFYASRNLSPEVILIVAND